MHIERKHPNIIWQKLVYCSQNC